jgi:sigma-B regulation protein RsbU (phosphoserine phosphatase)
VATSNLVERLTFQIESLQEGFELLSKASNVKELARQFSHILRGNFGASDIHIYYTLSSSDSWQRFYGKGKETSEYLPDATSAFSVKGFGGREPKLAATQPLVDKTCVGVVLGKRLDGTAYATLDKISLHVFLQLFANAYHAYQQRTKEKDLVFSVNHRLLQLNSLIDTGIELSLLREERALHEVAIERAAMLTNASRGFVTVSSGKQIKERIAFPTGDVPRRTPRSSHRIRSGFKYAGATYTFELHDKESRAGTAPFEETDQLLLDALTRQVQAAIENRYLHAQEIEKQKIERDITVAAAIQQRILPKSLPAIEGYDLFGINIPTKAVGGDYYDCIPIGDGKFALVIADVSGKGVPAALLVSSMHAYLSAFLESRLTLVELAQKMNRAIYNASTDDKFITAFFGILTPATGDLECLSAGHNPVYWSRNDDTIVELQAGGVALGMMDMDFPFQTDRITIEKGERVLLYTDGVTEAVNERLELYDAVAPLKQFVLRTKSAAAQQFIQELMADLKTFCGAAAQADDITAMYLLRR